MTAKIGVLTISDRASAGIYEDKSGPAILAFLREVLVSPWEPVMRVIPDERALIEATLVALCRRGRLRARLHDRWDGTGRA